MKRSVFDNVAYGLKVRGDHKRLKTRVYDALFLVGLAPDQFAGRMWRALSGGEAQRVSLAARLVLEPKVLLLDEPTASVDATSEQIIKEVALSARKQRGTTLVIASHDRQWLYEICDETVHLFNGKWFGSGMETLVFGPWKPLQDGRWAKVLNGSRMLVVPEPPHPDAVAVFHPDCLTLTPTADTGGADRHTLAGEITRCSLWRAHHRIAATVVVDNLGFTVLLTGEDIARHGIMPGQPVYLHYDAAGIQWHTFQGQ
jgi:tungstate transport system ATP-binding protein